MLERISDNLTYAFTSTLLLYVTMTVMPESKFRKFFFLFVFAFQSLIRQIIQIVNLMTWFLIFLFLSKKKDQGFLKQLLNNFF